MYMFRSTIAGGTPTNPEKILAASSRQNDNVHGFFFMLRAVFGVVCCIVAWISVAFAQAQTISQALSDPQFVRTWTWKAGGSLETMLRDWPAYTGRQEFDDKTVVSSAQMTILGNAFTTEYRVFSNNSQAELAIYSDSHSEDFCPAFLGWVSKRLGRPSKIVDLSKIGRESGFADVTADWLLGQTRVQLSCFEAKVHNRYIPGLAVLLYRRKDRLKVLEDLAYIDCSSTKKYVGFLADRRTEETVLLRLIIDPNRGLLLWPDTLPFLETRKYTDKEILASIEDEKVRHDFRLDRMTGSYQWNVRVKEDSRTGVDQWGNCSQVDPPGMF